MKIREFEEYLNPKNKSYNIYLNCEEDDVLPEEITLCLKYQHPETRAVVCGSHINENGRTCVGMYILGLNLGGKE